MPLVPSQAMIFSNKRGSGDYLYFMAVIPGDAFPEAVAGGSPCPRRAGRVGGSARGGGAKPRHGWEGCAGGTAARQPPLSSPARPEQPPAGTLASPGWAAPIRKAPWLF